MTRRSTAKKIDYSKFATSGSSTDDDDFESNLPPPKKKTKEKNVKEKRRCQDSNTKRNEKSKAPERKTRNSRTSNAEQIYENDLLKALEASKNLSTTTNTKDSQKKDVINLDSDSDEEKMMKLLANKRLTSTTEGTESEDSALADTLPMNKQRLTTDTEEENVDIGKVKVKVQKVTSDTEEENIGRRKVKVKGQRLTSDTEDEDFHNDKDKLEEALNKGESNKPSVEAETTEKKSREERKIAAANEYCENEFKDGKTTFTKVSKITAKKQSNKNVIKNPLKSHNDNHIKTKSSVKTETYQASNLHTPVRLRLGLSRKGRISKPLHQNVSFTNIS